MKITHVVLKNADIEKLPMRLQANLSEVQETVMRNRLAEKKRGVPKYYVINTDEPYAEEIIEVLKRNGHWGGRKVKPIKFKPIRDIYWDNWGCLVLVFSKRKVYNGELYENGRITAASPYWNVEDYINENDIEILMETIKV